MRGTIGLSRLGAFAMASMGAAIAMTGREVLGEKEHLSSDAIESRRRHEAAQYARRGNDQVRVYLKARTHRDAALAGGGAREVARRQRQLAKGQLRVSAA